MEDVPSGCPINTEHEHTYATHTHTLVELIIVQILLKNPKKCIPAFKIPSMYVHVHVHVYTQYKYKNLKNAPILSAAAAAGGGDGGGDGERPVDMHVHRFKTPNMYTT